MLLFAQSLDGLLDHRNVIWIGAAFLLLQLYLCLRFYLRLRRFSGILYHLLQSRESPPTAEAVRVHARRFPWLDWVSANFLEEDATGANYSRDDVLQELDTRVASNPHY